MNESIFEILEHTNRSLFLTGKAGTGKTTFLNEFVKKTNKKYVVVAPTGIAAINAGGVTIHSMFGLPLRTFLPTTERIDQNTAMNIADLMPHFKYRKDKQKLLRELEILIIDEVSMLRADVLDMMDFSLRFVRRNGLKFGGVQMLFIGDLYQLPPVVRDENVMKKFYKSPYFFESIAIKEIPLITLELNKIYRQTDETFIAILNAIREGNVENIPFNDINQRYQPNFSSKEEGYIYLCSHNRMADEINTKRLSEIKSESQFFEAKVHGTFNENHFPNEAHLELKVGAQIMFIRNDSSSEKKYFNGKIGEVSQLLENEIYVLLDSCDEEIVVKREVWEMKKYSLDQEKKIKEEVLGSFEQFPIKLAWAVTIHKSQGLTFDKVIIDAGESFTSGQVYVALSRCRTLDGIVLKSKIEPKAIIKDDNIVEFLEQTNANQQINTILANEKYDYSIRKIILNLDSRWLLHEIEIWHEKSLASKFLDENKVKSLATKMKVDISKLTAIYLKTERILTQKIEDFLAKKEDWNSIEQKCKGAVNYFFSEVQNNFYIPLSDFYAEYKSTKGLKQYNEDLKNLIEDIEEYLLKLQKTFLLSTPLIEDTKTIKVSNAKVPSHLLSYRLLEEGKSVSEIAKARGLVKETIMGHLAKFASQGVLDITRVISLDKIAIFEKAYHSKKLETLNEWKNALPIEFEFNEIRILMNHFSYKFPK